MNEDFVILGMKKYIPVVCEFCVRVLCASFVCDFCVKFVYIFLSGILQTLEKHFLQTGT